MFNKQTQSNNNLKLNSIIKLLITNNLTFWLISEIQSKNYINWKLIKADLQKSSGLFRLLHFKIRSVRKRSFLTNRWLWVINTATIKWIWKTQSTEYSSTTGII